MYLFTVATLLQRRCQISLKNWICNDLSHKKRLSRSLEAKKINQYLKHMHFFIFEAKEAVEAIMADGAIEATEVIKFTSYLSCGI